MTKKDIINIIATKTNLPQHIVHEVVQLTINSMSDALVRGESITIRNFGVFNVVTTKSKLGRNPKNPSVEVTIPARKNVKFRIGKELKDKLFNAPVEE